MIRRVYATVYNSEASASDANYQDAPERRTSLLFLSRLTSYTHAIVDARNRRRR